MKRILLIGLIMMPSLLKAGQFMVYYFLPRGDSSRLSMTVEAPDSGTARRIFTGLLPNARISEVKETRSR
jgi:hypothetical protein